MSNKDDGSQLPTAGGYNAGGSLVAFPRPDEVVVPLRRDEFDILREGGANSEKASRDLYIGIGFTAVVGLIGVLATVDWGNAWQTGHRTWLLPFLVLLVMTAGSLVGAAIFHFRLRKILINSPFSRLGARLSRWFDESRTLDGAIGPLLKGASEQTGTNGKWQNVANVFWLGSDLESALRFLWGSGSKEKIVDAVGQASHHASELGLSGTEPGQLLSLLRSQAQAAPETALNKQWRDDLAGRVIEARRGFASLTYLRQPWFRARP